MIAHPLAVFGLVLNAAGTIGLLYTTRTPFNGGTLPVESIRSALPDYDQMLRRALRPYRASVAALLLGFALQLIDLLTA